MARLPRLYLPGCAQHVIQRGNNREACFYDEADYKAYLSFLKDASAKYQVAIHAFVLMTNHVHLELAGTMVAPRIAKVSGTNTKGLIPFLMDQRVIVIGKFIWAELGWRATCTLGCRSRETLNNG